MMIYILTGLSIGIDFPPVSNDTKIVAVMGMGLMIGWTVLLIWGDRKPIERRIILAFTVCPVLVLILSFELILFFSNSSTMTPVMVIFNTIIRLTLITIFLIAYFFARQMENRKKNIY